MNRLVLSWHRTRYIYSAGELMRTLTKSIARIQAIILILFSTQAAWCNEERSLLANSQAESAAVHDQKQMFMTTQPIETDAGPAYMEVTSFKIQNERDLNSAREMIIGQIKYKAKTNELFKLHITAKDQPVNQHLAVKTEAVVGEIENLVQALEKLEPKNIEVEKPKQSFLQRHYNLTLSFVRFVANSGVVSVGLITGKGVPLEHAFMIGALAGALSGAIQLKSTQVFAWLSHSVLLVNSAKRMGLISNTDGITPQRSERILREVETYSKWALLETGFLLSVHTAMGLLNIPVTENLFETVAKSTLSQGVFEVGILKASEQLEKMNSNWNNKVAVFKNVSIFAGSSISVLAAIGSMVGMPYSNLGFVVLTGTGLILNFSSKIIFSESGQRILSRWKTPITPAVQIKSCRQLMMRIAS
jgi:hypothetical protein